MEEGCRHIECVEESMPRKKLIWDKPLLKTFSIYDMTRASTIDFSGPFIDGQDTP